LQTAFRVGAGGGALIGVVVAGVLVGIAVGFLHPLFVLFLDRPFATLVAMAFGAAFSAVVVFCTAAFERTSLRLRGYRRLSQEELRLVLKPASDVARSMNLGTLPRFAMYDNPLPNAWTGARTIVLTSGVLKMLEETELRALLAHELAHWQAADAVGEKTVWACSLPLALMVNIGSWLSSPGIQPWIALTLPRSELASMASGMLRFLAWILFWPGELLTRFVIVPALLASKRRREYDADAVVAELGLAPAWISALPKITGFEGGRTGWEATMARTHPPTALRIERLQARLADDHLYEPQELDGAAWDALRLLGQLFTRPH